jgi:hypothetical protein
MPPKPPDKKDLIDAAKDDDCVSVVAGAVVVVVSDMVLTGASTNERWCKGKKMRRDDGSTAIYMILMLPVY